MLLFSEGMERDKWHEMANIYNIYALDWKTSRQYKISNISITQVTVTYTW